MAWVADTVLLGAENPGRLVAPTALLTWKMVNQKMPWNIVLLLGGGFALAKGSEVRAPPAAPCPTFTLWKGDLIPTWKSHISRRDLGQREEEYAQGFGKFLPSISKATGKVCFSVGKTCPEFSTSSSSAAPPGRCKVHACDNHQGEP